MNASPIAVRVPNRATSFAPSPKSRRAEATLPSAARERPLLGIALIVAATVFFSVSDVLAKALSSSLPAVEIAWLRYVTFSLLILPMLLPSGGKVLRSHRPGLQVLRAFGMLGSALLFIAGLRFLPVADATAINFVSPIFITALSVLVLGETVGWRRWAATCVGLIGVLIVVRPGTSAFDPAAAFPLVAALTWAGTAVVTRKMSGERPLTTLAYSALVGTFALTALLPFSWVLPSWWEITLGVGIGAISTVGHWLIVLAFRHAKASALAPFSYTQLVWSGALGFLVFGSMPDGWTLVGAGVIVASGLYTAHRERVRAVVQAHQDDAAQASTR
jgi:drug/metabolite transporter (DMT)-like permease